MTTIAEIACDAALDVPDDLGAVVLPRAGQQLDVIRRLRRTAARQYLARLLKAVRRLRGTGGSSLPGARLALDVLDRVDLDTALRLALRPDVTAWVWRAEAAAPADVAGLDKTLAALLAGDALALEIRCEVALGAVAAGSAVLLWPQRTRVLGTGGPAAVSVDCSGVVALGGDGSALPCVPADTVRGAVVVDPADLLVDALAGLDDPLRPGAGLAAAVGDAVDVLGAVWPVGAQAVEEELRALGRLDGHWGGTPFNYSVHGYRGLVLTSVRRSYKLAQTLVHEVGHNRFSHVTDCFRTAHNADAQGFSPFVQAARPVNHLLHGMLSFVNDVYCAIRCGAVVDGAELPGVQAYVRTHRDRLREGRRSLGATIDPTPRGEQLLAGIDTALAVLEDAVG
ncbi:MAG: aKG-HExxH-type peptide beta-hydroxylase [Pseudonocardia sp.]